MKKLMLALLLVSSATHAEQWLEAGNSAGGKMILLNTLCNKSETGKVVISTTPEGPNINGCWYYFAELIHVVWSDGATASFEPSRFAAKGKK